MTDTIAGLHARTALLASHLSAHQRAVALRALRRILKTAGRVPCPADADGLAVLLGQAQAQRPHAHARHADEEAAALEAALRLPPVPATLLAAMLAGRQTLADALAAVDLQTWDAGERSRIRGAVLALLERAAPGMAVEAVPATEGRLNALLAGLRHTDFGQTPGSFANVRSRGL